MKEGGEWVNGSVSFLDDDTVSLKHSVGFCAREGVTVGVVGAGDRVAEGEGLICLKFGTVRPDKFFKAVECGEARGNLH